MPKKTKKSSPKSDKERQLLLQQRGQAEEELKEKKEETLGLFLKDKLQDEQRNKAVITQKINDSYREMLRLAQDSEQQRKIIMWQQMFEKELDDLESIKKKNEREIQELDHFEMQMSRCHREYMASVLALQAKHLLSLEQQWNSSLQEIRAGRSCQRQHMLLESQQFEAQLQNLKLTDEQQNKDALNDIKGFYEETLQNYVKTLEEKMAGEECNEELKQAIQKNIESLQHSDKLSANTEPLLPESEEIRSDIFNIVKKLEENICRLEREGISEEEALTAAINEAKLKGETLRKERTRAQKAARKRLTKLVMQGDAATQKLKAVIAKGESVLRKAEICMKLEKKNETLLASVSSSSGPTDEVSNTSAKEVCSFPELQHLERRISNAMLVQAGIRQEKKELRNENRELKCLIAQHQSKQPPALHITPVPTMSTPPDLQNWLRRRQEREGILPFFKGRI